MFRLLFKIFEDDFVNIVLIFLVMSFLWINYYMQTVLCDVDALIHLFLAVENLLSRLIKLVS